MALDLSINSGCLLIYLSTPSKILSDNLIVNFLIVIFELPKYRLTPTKKKKLIESKVLNYSTTAYCEDSNCYNEIILDRGYPPPNGVEGESIIPTHLLSREFNFSLGGNITKEARLTNVWIFLTPDEDSVDANYTLLNENGTMIYEFVGKNYSYPRLISNVGSPSGTKVT